jgi:hypothetical protein
VALVQKETQTTTQHWVVVFLRRFKEGRKK